jgi:hypothetical protein
MKIEIDLNEILEHEGGVESIKESVCRQITDHLSRSIKDRVKDRINEVLADSVKKAIDEKIPVFMADLLDSEYTVVDRYGSANKGETTLRKELVNTIKEQMQYKSSRYDNDKNAFTRAVEETVGVQVKDFQRSFNALVTEQFTKDAMEFAVSRLRERLGMPKV